MSSNEHIKIKQLFQFLFAVDSAPCERSPFLDGIQRFAYLYTAFRRS